MVEKLLNALRLTSQEKGAVLRMAAYQQTQTQDIAEEAAPQSVQPRSRFCFRWSPFYLHSQFPGAAFALADHDVVKSALRERRMPPLMSDLAMELGL